jgi:HIRAN domain
MIIATFNSATGWAGKTITFDDGVFTLEGYGEILASGVMGYDAQGLLQWAYAGLREWAASLTPPAQETAAQTASAEPRPTAADFEASFRGAIRGGKPPKRRECERIYRSIDECQDEQALRAMRDGAQSIYGTQGGFRRDGYSLEDRPPTAAEDWLDALVYDRINVRLRAFRVRPVKPPSIVGETHHQEALGRVFSMTKGASGTKTRAATLVPEPGNQYDANAVAVVVRGERIGYLKRNVAAEYSPALQRMGKPLECRVRLERQGPESGQGAILAFFEDVLPPASSLA